MQRQIVQPTEGAAATGTSDDYKDRLLKYIPAEAIGLYLAIAGIVKSSDEDDLKTALAIVFFVGLVFTPLYLLRVARVTSKVQLAVSTLAFAVWVFAIGDWFATMDWYGSAGAAIVLIVVTASIPLIIPPDAPEG